MNSRKVQVRWPIEQGEAKEEESSSRGPRCSGKEEKGGDEEEKVVHLEVFPFVIVSSLPPVRLLSPSLSLFFFLFHIV